MLHSEPRLQGGIQELGHITRCIHIGSGRTQEFVSLDPAAGADAGGLRQVRIGLDAEPGHDALVRQERLEVDRPSGGAARLVASALVIVLRLMGMTIGLSALTAWGLHRFNTWGQAELPLLTDPGYMDSLTRITARVLRETFVISAVVSFIAFLPGAALRGRDRRA